MFFFTETYHMPVIICYKSKDIFLLFAFSQAENSIFAQFWKKLSATGFFHQ